MDRHRPTQSVDTTRPYLVRFASGASIAVFFYNGPTSRAIAFEGLLNSGENFAARLKAGFKDSAQPQLVHVATDGESYGHHHQSRRNGAGLRAAPAGAGQDRQADQLRQLPRAVSAGVRVRNRRQHFVELRARRRALALQLRLQRRQARLEPGVARALAPGPR